MNLIKVSDAVDELSLARRDDNRGEWLRYFILSKTVLRDLKIKYLNDFKRVYLAVNQSTNTVRIPFDFYRFRTISIIENCKDRFGKTSEKVIPLTLNPYINITPQEAITCNNACNCEINHPVCQELSDYTVTEEDIIIDEGASPSLNGVRQTILRTCANGDIIKEVTEPVQKWIEGTQVCDYTIAIERNMRTICDYNFSVVVPLSSGFFLHLFINGVEVISEELTITTIDNYMEGLGWTVSNVGTTFTFTLEDSSEIYGLEGFYIADPVPLRTDFNIERQCAETNSIEFPFDIVSYVLNGETITPSPAETIVYQSDLDAFFGQLGFDKVDDTHYTLEGSEDVFFSMIIETSDSPALEININFVQDHCHKPLINDGYENKLFTDVLCNVVLKECGCIAETASNISTIVSCCSSYLHCCQVGELNNYSGWNVVPACCPTNNEQPYNRFGEYNLDEKNFLIYLSSVNASRVLLAYDSDSICDGEYFLPDYAMNAMKAGIAWYAAQYDEQMPYIRRRELKGNYVEEINKVISDYTDPLRMAELINALKTRKYPY